MTDTSNDTSTDTETSASATTSVTTSKTPDIEIYIKRAETEQILTWLSQTFEIGDRRQAADTLKLSLIYQGQPLSGRVIEKAAKGGFVCIGFEPNATPWMDDASCAADAYGFFGLEVRCSTSGWTEDDEETQGWYRFTDSGRSVVNWLT